MRFVSSTSGHLPRWVTRLRRGLPSRDSVRTDCCPRAFKEPPMTARLPLGRGLRSQCSRPFPRLLGRGAACSKGKLNSWDFFPKRPPIWIHYNRTHSLINVLYLHAGVWGTLNSGFRGRKRTPRARRALTVSMAWPAALPAQARRCAHVREWKCRPSPSSALPARWSGKRCPLHLCLMHRESCALVLASDAGQLYWWRRCLS